jgi:hypothetical protein
MLLLFILGGGVMSDPNEPPPALAADASLSAFQAKMASQNLAIAASNMLGLIRTLRLSALLMDERVIAAEEQEEYEACTVEAQLAAEQSAELEGELLQLWREELAQTSQT